MRGECIRRALVWKSGIGEAARFTWFKTAQTGSVKQACKLQSIVSRVGEVGHMNTELLLADSELSQMPDPCCCCCLSMCSCWLQKRVGVTLDERTPQNGWGSSDSTQPHACRVWRLQAQAASHTESALLHTYVEIQIEMLRHQLQVQRCRSCLFLHYA